MWNGGVGHKAAGRAKSRKEREKNGRQRGEPQTDLELAEEVVRPEIRGSKVLTSHGPAWSSQAHRICPLSELWIYGQVSGREMSLEHVILDRNKHPLRQPVPSGWHGVGVGGGGAGSAQGLE